MCDESDGVIGIAIMNRVITCPADSIHAAMIRVLLPSCLGAGHSAWIIGNDQNGYSIYDTVRQKLDTFLWWFWVGEVARTRHPGKTRH